MRLDVLVPTLDRADLLERALRSLVDAPAPDDLDVRITVIDNGSIDRTPALVEQFARAQGGRTPAVAGILEPRRGKSRALNAGIDATSGDLVGMVDDDEEVDAGWYRAVARAFADPRVDFIGGPYRAAWSTPRPAWLPEEYLAVIGEAYSGPVEREFGPDFPGILKGGNAVIRRRVLSEVGPYAEDLGPTDSARLLSCEDEEMYYRLLAHGARGRYVPSLVIYHHVDPARLTPSYYRRWCYWRGVSRGMLDRKHPMSVPYLAGVPRFLFGRAFRGAKDLMASVFTGHTTNRLASELSLWDLGGYLHGRHFYRRWGSGSPRRARKALP
jgi:glycosyltransferase involved in cell wall biosynthesis